MRLGIPLVLICVCCVGAVILLAPRMDFACIAQRVSHANDDYYSGWSCLHYAAIRGDVETIDEILQSGAPGDQRNSLGRTPLMEAARDGELAAVNRLILRGADVNATDEAGFTALHLAAQAQNAAVVRRLLRANAAVNALNQWHQTPLWLVSWQPEVDTTQIAHSLVSNGANVNLADENGNTPLHMAARAGRYRMVAYLLEAGARVTATNEQGRTPLYLAVIGNNLRSARLLLRHGANPNTRAGDTTALELALNKGYRDMADLLAAHGALGYQRYAAGARTERGRTRLEAGRLNAAVAAFDAALAVAPNNATAHYYRGLAFMRMGQLERALADFRKTLAIAPHHAGALEHAGLAYAQRGQYKRAVQQYKQLIAVRPDYGRGYHLLAKALYQLGRKAAAQSTARKACQLGYKAAC